MNNSTDWDVVQKTIGTMMEQHRMAQFNKKYDAKVIELAKAVMDNAKGSDFENAMSYEEVLKEVRSNMATMNYKF